eukprot:CAMPEP_0197415434 /NCGR_PEP_ID=MMETSP1170-20131217/1974_1 /TAXON_ID=54406 /ORGANISM="Sarcinochrysis sp, Strain CCMP770" /LENGTH=107 /DNA_ID=CAMNT_0042942237 /DNA_START=317 /DNA_END=643 /DNA_ORIENTATION=-
MIARSKAAQGTAAQESAAHAMVSTVADLGMPSCETECQRRVENLHAYGRTVVAEQPKIKSPILQQHSGRGGFSSRSEDRDGLRPWARDVARRRSSGRRRPRRRGRFV